MMNEGGVVGSWCSWLYFTRMKLMLEVEVVRDEQNKTHINYGYDSCIHTHDQIHRYKTLNI